eukprot:scaffold143842_cov127-Phaeocystis_antarctica.AAC.1
MQGDTDSIPSNTPRPHGEREPAHAIAVRVCGHALRRGGEARGRTADVSRCGGVELRSLPNLIVR